MISREKIALIRNLCLVCMSLFFCSGNGYAKELLQWSELPSLPSELGVAGPFAGISGNSLIVAGGANFAEPVWENQKEWHDKIYVLEKEEDGYTWHAAGKLPKSIGYGMSVSYNGRVICMGGNDQKKVYSDVFSLYWDSKTKKVSINSLPNLPVPCAFGQAVLVKDVIYVAGGQSQNGLDSAMRNFWSLDLSLEGTEDFAWKILMPWPGPERALNILTVQNNGRDDCVYLMLSLIHI